MKNEREQFLLFRIRAFKDESAFNVLLETHGKKVRRFFEIKLPTNEDAQDAFSETWMRLWNYAQSTKIDSFAGTLYAIGRNVVAEFYRKRERPTERAVELDESLSEASEPLHEAIIAQVDVELLKDQLASLPEQDTQLIIMRHIECLRVKDIAKLIGKSENATSIMLHRAIKKLRESIKKKFGEL